MARLILLITALCTFCLAFGQTAKIKPGDKLQVICKEEPTLNRDYDVLKDGLILVDFLGAVKVEGLTEAQAADEISKRLVSEKILRKATITVAIISAEIKRVVFSGAIKTPAETPWKENMRLSDIVRLAEVTAETDLTKVTIVSRSGKKTVYNHLDRDGKDWNPLIQPGDKVFFIKKEATKPIETKEPVDNTKPTTDNPSTTRPETSETVIVGYVTINGQVTKPGRFPIEDQLTLREALDKAGGFSQAADVKSVSLRRGDSVRELTLPENSGFPLKSEDVVIVNERKVRSLIGMVTLEGSVAEPGEFGLYEDMHLSELISISGGFIPGARTNKIRIYTPGYKSPITLDYEEFLLGYTGDYLLKPGQRVEIDGPKRRSNSSVTKAAAGALVLFFLFG